MEVFTAVGMEMDCGGEKFSEYGCLLAGAEVGELELAKDRDDFLTFAAEFAGEGVEGAVVDGDWTVCGLHG